MHWLCVGDVWNMFGGGVSDALVGFTNMLVMVQCCVSDGLARF